MQNLRTAPLRDAADLSVLWAPEDDAIVVVGDAGEGPG
jgi:hypothetical protein